MKTSSQPRFTRMALMLGGMAFIGELLIGADANATFSGTTSIKVPVAGNFTPNDFPPGTAISGSYWYRKTPARMSLVAGLTGPGTWRYGGVSVAAPRWQASTTFTPNARIFGGDGFSNRPQACVIATSYWHGGSIAGQTAWYCTTGTTMTSQAFSMGSITLPEGGAVVFDIAAAGGDTFAPDTAGAELVGGSWVMNGG